MLVRAPGGRVDVMCVPRHVACRIGLLLDETQDLLPQSLLAPAIEAAGNTAPESKTGGHIAPGGASAVDPEHAFDHAAMVVIWSSGRGFFGWQEQFQPLPLRFRQCNV
jgi:hypothetical protein